MSLNITVPASGQTLAFTRDPIRNNFVSINDQFELDHYAFNSTNNGLHKKVTLPEQASAPPRVAAAGLIYSVHNATSNDTELVFARASGSTAPNATRVVDFTYALRANSGWTRLASGLLLKWQKSVTLGAGTPSITLTTATAVAGSPAYTNLYSIQVTSGNVGGNTSQVYSAISPGLDTIAITRSSSSGEGFFSWFTIGI